MSKASRKAKGSALYPGSWHPRGVAQIPIPLIIRLKTIHFLDNFLKTKIMKPVLKHLGKKEPHLL